MKVELSRSPRPAKLAAMNQPRMKRLLAVIGGGLDTGWVASVIQRFLYFLLPS
ncbi:hypothetical protein RISK_001997 [Rhodopirellula islandica]|uniref:Uncharacterized protein n=1 Tax=Rhodopirellula islandica TaxID=595434 RepID=A0A0J1BHX5_RHOIS|nr:hypothetical protein RISK_001997 [Rhodopirellula islandica]